MTDIVTFQNPGLIPMEAVTTMGVSVKEGDTPIGFFGTGLKYAIASLLRTGQRITIWRGLDRYDFTTVTSKVRSKEFDFIIMTGSSQNGAQDGPSQRLGFTTHLGSRWEMWQIFRELHSNALDEGGTSAVTRLEPREGYTTIHATGTAIADAASKRREIFLETTPMVVLDRLAIHPGGSDSIYYRGVKVASINKRSVFTYNITEPTVLTEDRTLKDPWYAFHSLMSSLGMCEDERILDPVLTSKDSWERDQRFPAQCDEFSRITLALMERHGPFEVHPGALVAAEQWARRSGIVKQADLSKEDKATVQEACSFLEAIGYPVTYPIIIADSLGPGIFGMAKDEKIYIAKTVIDRGGNFLISTLLEERLHLSHSFQDNSRAFQDFLLDMAIKFACDAKKIAVPTGKKTEIVFQDNVNLVDEMPF